MRGINLLPQDYNAQEGLLRYRQWSLTASILIVALVAILSVVVFLLDLYFQGNARKLAVQVADAESRVKTKSGVESLNYALKTRAQAIRELKATKQSHVPVLQSFLEVIGSEAIISDISVDNNQATVSFSIPSSSALALMLARIQSPESYQRFKTFTLVSLTKDTQAGWRASLIAEVAL